MASSTAPRSVVIKVNGRLVLETKRQSSPTKGVDPEVMFYDCLLFTVCGAMFTLRARQS